MRDPNKQMGRKTFRNLVNGGVGQYKRGRPEFEKRHAMIMKARESAKKVVIKDKTKMYSEL